jgi:hypothetical protein
VEGRATRREALRRYAELHEAKRGGMEMLKRVQDVVSLVLPTPLLGPFARVMSDRRVQAWGWRRYGDAFPPPPAAVRRPRPARAPAATA